MKGHDTKENKYKKRIIKSLALLSTTFLMAMSSHLNSYALERPNTNSEIEPNNTRETAQRTQPTNEIPEKFAEDDWSGRYSMYGTANSSDDDWYKVDLPIGVQYLSVVHSYGDNATYVEMFDSENNEIISRKYGTRYNVTKFYSNGGTYYIHIVGASENDNKYTLLVGTPMLSSDGLYVTFDPLKTSGTITKSFSFVDEEKLPKDSIVSKITLWDLPLNFSGACVTNTTSQTSITYSNTSLSEFLGSLKLNLKSDWEIEFYPKGTVTSIPRVCYIYFYPVYDDTTYPHLPTFEK